MNNLELWNKLEPTDPSHTKQFNRSGGFSGTAINATYILKRLTETFGPCGRGWKFALEDERIEDGHTLKTGDRAKLHIVRGHLEYMQEGQWFQTSPQFGQTMLVGENKYGAFTDEEAPKKSITDCISKCAVTIGIGADVHLGLFDDNKYLNQRKQEEAANGNGEQHPIERQNGGAATLKADPVAAAKTWVKTAKETIKAFNSPEALSAWEDVNKNTIVRLHSIDPKAHKELMQAIQDRHTNISPLAA
jgi:hypothetical protein